MKKTVALITLGIVSVFVFGLLRNVPTAVSPRRLIAPPVVHAQGGCSVATLQGEYLVTGRAVNPSGQSDPTFPRVMIAVWTFDGAGNMSGLNTTSEGGLIRRRALVAATYALDSDCNGTLTFLGSSMSEGVAVRPFD